MNTTTAAIYCRISQDSEGEGLGVARQEEDCRALAERHGLTVADVYVDNDLGASTRSRKPRPAYARLLADAAAGRVGVVLAYSNSRLTRRLRELEDLIQLHERHGIRILTVVSGEDNLSTADGRMVARIKASVDSGEAERTAERVARKHLENARAGKAVGGRRPFGYEDDKVTVRDSEAALVRQAAADVLAGTGLTTIARQWNAAGVRTVTGSGPWSAGKLLQLLRSPRLAGWRVHRVAGTKWAAVPPVAVGKDGQPVRGKWEPILDDATHRALVALLTNSPERRKRVPRRNARTYLMTGLLRCAVCNGPMYANKVGDSHYYRCDAPDCSNSASGQGIDAWVSEAVVEHSELVAANTTPGSPGEDRLRELNEQINDAAEMIEDVMGAYRARQISGGVAFASAGQLEATRDELVAERNALEVERARAGVAEIDAETWAGMDTDRRRAAAERVLVAVYVRRPTKHSNRFDASRLDPVWK